MKNEIAVSKPKIQHSMHNSMCFDVNYVPFKVKI